MGSLLSLHIAFDAKREDKVEVGGMGRLVKVIDGDNVRQGVCRDLSFSPEGRAENLRRISEMIRLFLDAGIICLTAFISLLCADREEFRK